MIKNISYLYNMKKLFFILLLCPLLSMAQKLLPRFENDTLYTSSGYTIYKGQILHLANGTSAAGYFKFIKFHYSMGKNNTYTLQNSTILVNKLKNYKSSGADDNSIRILGSVTYTDGKKEEADIILNFDKAIENINGQPAELTVPETFKPRRTVTVPVEMKKQTTAEETKKQSSVDELKKLMVADEIKKLFDLYKAGALTKQEYEAQKKKLLEKL